MTNQLTNISGDDGFSGGLSSRGLIRGTLLTWNETEGWLTHDEQKPPEILLGFALDEALQRWKNKKPETKTEKPLEDPKVLNAAIPESEWELGLDGKPRPPWEHVVVVYLLDPATGAFYTYVHGTMGAHAAWDALREMVIATRALRGARVVPVLSLGWRPWRTKVGMKRRPHFEILDWRKLGGGDDDDGGKALPQQPAPKQLGGPTAAQPETPPWETEAKSTAKPASKPALSKAATETLAATQPVKPITPSEWVDDEVKF
jgi:hypothetical protein